MINDILIYSDIWSEQDYIFNLLTVILIEDTLNLIFADLKATFNIKPVKLLIELAKTVNEKLKEHKT